MAHSYSLHSQEQLIVGGLRRGIDPDQAKTAEHLGRATAVWQPSHGGIVVDLAKPATGPYMVARPIRLVRGTTELCHQTSLKPCPTG